MAFVRHKLANGGIEEVSAGRPGGGEVGFELVAPAHEALRLGYYAVLLSDWGNRDEEVPERPELNSWLGRSGRTFSGLAINEGRIE